MRFETKESLPSGTNLDTVRIAQKILLEHLKRTEIIEDFIIDQYGNQNIAIIITRKLTYWQKFKRWLRALPI